MRLTCFLIILTTFEVSSQDLIGEETSSAASALGLREFMKEEIILIARLARSIRIPEYGRGTLSKLFKASQDVIGEYPVTSIFGQSRGGDSKGTAAPDLQYARVGARLLLSSSWGE
ncbi:hypothetical protein ACH5RR_037796 [Cinchona calisaya]|uniref:Uncharacterized protein n=1 Tax=Cinchona calisaya TaxID=153742 RepID=A0ABD2YA92_9GENT